MNRRKKAAASKVANKRTVDRKVSATFDKACMEFPADLHEAGSREQANKKYAKYRGKPRDWQQKIARSGPDYEFDLPRLIFEVTAAVAAGGTPLIIPHPQELWYQTLVHAVRTGDASEIRKAAYLVERAFHQKDQPVDLLALQLLARSQLTDDEMPTVAQFIRDHYPHAIHDDSMRRRVQMVAESLGVRLKPAAQTKRASATGIRVYSKKKKTR